MDLSRRRLLEALTAGAALGSASPAAFALQATAPAQWRPNAADLLPGPVFRHGVASGDPLQRQVILWTRVTPESEQPVAVLCRVARDARMSRVVSEYRLLATSRTDFTVKLDAGGLEPGKTYYYQFSARGE